MRGMIDAAGLRVMKAIADEGSFTAAATSLGYTQPAISQMVRRLEQRTGTVLVERVGRNVRLTEAGQVLARHATPVLAAIDAAEEEVAAIAGLRSGRVRLMAFPSASATLVPRALSLVKKRFPDISITLTEAEPPESLAALKAGECDLAVAFAYEGTDVGRGEDLDPFIIRPLMDDEVRLAMPPDNSDGNSFAVPRKPTASSFISTRSRIISSGRSVCSRNWKAMLSNTLMSVNRAPNWNSMPIFRRIAYIASASSVPTSSPLTSTRPREAFS